MKKKIITAASFLIFTICCVFAWNYATNSSSKSLGGDKIPAHEEEKIRQELQEKELSTRIKDLKNDCVQLTQNSDGNTFEAFWGNYIADKSLSSVREATGRTAIYRNMITLKSNGKEVSSMSENYNEEDFKQRYMPFIHKIIFTEKSNFENDLFGLCAYENSYGNYIHAIETLIAIKEE